MEKITGERCIELMKENFPKFSTYWDSYIENYGSDLGLTIQMSPFEDYAVDAIKAKDEIKIKKIFDFVEFLLINGDESVQGAIATGFLEYLMNITPEQIKSSAFVQYMGKNAIEYCRAWDEFCGVRTEGLWTEDERNALIIEKQVHPIEGYRIAKCFLEKYYFKTHPKDIGTLLSKMQFVSATETADPNALKSWKESVKTIKSKCKRGGFDIVEAYQTLQCFLEQYQQLTKSKDIGTLLKEMDLLGYKNTRDPAAWSNWIECVNSCILWEQPVK